MSRGCALNDGSVWPGISLINRFACGKGLASVEGSSKAQVNAWQVSFTCLAPYRRD